ncbi:MAG TPA: F0F1 ATP synthase subunit A [Candidatus Deferrimicrobium sp.]|nr:F0F1 ATP synthase subunit A [Candidatus Deferrimicrobium sp.]
MGLYYVHIVALALARIGPWLYSVAVAASGDQAGADTTQVEHGDKTHLPNLISLIFGHDSAMYHWENVLFAFAVASLFIVCATIAYRRREMIPGRFQNFMEMLVEGMYNFIYSILGEDAKKYVPFLGTLFFYILAMNWLGMVPLGHSPSTSLTITASLAVIVFLYAQYTGMRRLGPLGYLHHMAGSPRDVISWCMVPLLFPLHIIGELAKPFSLSLRLFGNITGEDTLIAVFIMLGISILSFSPVGLPLQVPFYFLGLLLSTIQALVFTLLSTIYILLMLPHEEHAH